MDLAKELARDLTEKEGVIIRQAEEIDKWRSAYLAEKQRNQDLSNRLSAVERAVMTVTVATSRVIEACSGKKILELMEDTHG